jgi:hypothetical protein
LEEVMTDPFVSFLKRHPPPVTLLSRASHCLQDQ